MARRRAGTEQRRWKRFHLHGSFIDELILAYVRHAEGYYVKNGVQTGEVSNIKLALRSVRRLYGSTEARDFGPLALKSVRRTMIESNLCRTEINKRVRHVVRLFKWAVENEMVPPSTHQGLKAVAGLRRGRSEVRESEPVRPVPEDFVDAIGDRVSRQVWAMIQLQRLTGMRPGEVCILRSCDVDTTGKVWAYRPSSHKTEHHARDRLVYLGPRAQEVLRPWLTADLSVYVFSPRNAKSGRDMERRAARKSQVQPSQVCRAKSRPKKLSGVRYTTGSYRQAIVRACLAADVPPWHPHQLRHNAATWLRREFGLETARVVLGHASAEVTEGYAEADFGKAAEAMGRVG